MRARWGRRAVMVLALVLAVPACGTSDGRRAAEEPSTTTTAAAASTRCPHRPDPPPPPIEEGQFQDAADAEVARTYGEAHPDDFAGVAFEGLRIQAAFIAHLDEHEAALRPLLTHPDLLDVVQAAHTERELDGINHAVQALMGGNGQIQTAGRGFGYVGIGLVAGREDLAASYVERWGDAVEVGVGGRAYVPDGCGERPTPPPCPRLEGADPASAGLELTVVLDEPTISRYEQGQGHVRIRNVGSTPFRIDTGQPIVATMVDPGTDRVAATYTGAIAGTGFDVNLAPGEHMDVPMVVGTASCGREGTVLEPGTYGVVVVVGSEVPTDHRAYVSPEVPVTISDAPPPEVPQP